jgi:diguanylate cyclase (GGDEF)-like protein/PAS domain S-box-containing protein
VESSSDAIFMVDTQRTITSCNQAFLDLFGYEREEVENRSVRLIHASDASFDLYGQKAYPAVQKQGTFRTEWDFARKDGTTVLVESVTSAIKGPDGALKGFAGIIRDITERKRSEEALLELQANLHAANIVLAHEATHDPLTGILSRRAILDALSRELSRERRQHNGLAIGICDIDHFKKVNDTHGHPVGDEVLCGLVRLLESNLRQYDFLGRFGGEEFVVIMPGIKENDLNMLFERLRDAVADNPIPTKAGNVSITVSIGATTWRGNETKDKLLAVADSALYQAKMEGRNRVCFADRRIVEGGS